MDALTWFKTVFQREQESLHLAAARLRPPPAPAAPDDDDWDAVIARAKTLAAAKIRIPAPPPRIEWASMPDTPPPSRQTPAQTLAALNARLRRGQRW